MKIGYFSEKFLYNLIHNEYDTRIYPYGGGEVVAYNLAINIAKRGHDVFVFTTSMDFKDKVEDIYGVKVYRYSTILKIFRRNVSFGLLFRPNVDVDLVHAHICSEPFSLLAVLRFIKKMKLPLVVTYHGDTVKVDKNIIRNFAIDFHNNIVKKILSQADVIISPSKCYIDVSYFLRKFRYKIVVIPNGIYIKGFDNTPSKKRCRRMLGLPVDKYILLFLGALHKKKGLNFLLNAMSIVINEIPNTELVVAGEGLLKKDLNKLICKLNINKNIKFVGFVEENLKPYYFKSSDIFVLPSILTSESFGIVNLEAMACGTPIVASRIGGVPDVIRDGENGLLVPPKDTKALANAIIHLLQNNNMRKKMSKNAKKIVRNYSWDVVADKYEKIYESCVK